MQGAPLMTPTSFPQTLKRANNTHTIDSSIIYECVRTITTI